MSLPAIEVSGLSKRYVIEHESRHDNLRDTLHHAARKLWRRARWGTRFEREEFWALRDVSFSVQPGEVVGIIGRNGAGKSTLLKVLSRITEPTAGKIAIRGRVASLLEVGTGFHPDLTGRENIFLNGAILGMRRAEIREKFDEIVAFSEVEKFLDTPVKRYSSGMYVRLAFAVAAHLEPEILIVDEVLAVGDAVFQKKCLGKMQDVAKNQGRTVLFVSHNLVAVRQLCQRVIRLSEGRLAGSGAPDEQISGFLGAALQSATEVEFAGRKRGGAADPSAVYLSARADHPEGWLLPFGERLSLTLKIEVRRPASDLEFGVAVHTAQGYEICSTLSSWGPELGSFSPGVHELTVRFPALDLTPGGYQLSLGIRSSRGMEDHVTEALDFQVTTSAESASRTRLSLVRGVLTPRVDFRRAAPAP